MFRPLLLEHLSTTVRLGLAWSRVQPFPRKYIELRATGFELRANRCFGLLAARGPKLQACMLELREAFGGKPGL